MFRNLILTICCTILVSGCEDASKQVGPGMTFDPPSASATMLPPPTPAQQVQQPPTPTCAPSAAVTLYRMVTGKSYTLDQAAREMHTTANGTYLSEFINWMNDHGMDASITTVPTTAANDMILAQIKAGYYTAPYVNENAKPNAAHVFIVYGVDNGRILISDSNRHLGMNRIAVDGKIFQNQWLINVGTKDHPEAILVFVNSHPKKPTTGSGKTTAGSLVNSRYDSIIVK